MRDGRRTLVPARHDARARSFHDGGRLALTTFWAMVTVGRIAVVAVERWLPVRATHHLMPFVLAVTFVIIAFYQLATASPRSASARS